MDFTFEAGAERTFTVSSDKFVQNLQNFHFLLPVYNENTELRMVSPQGNMCLGSKLLGYSLVLTVDPDTCPYQVKLEIEICINFNHKLKQYADR